MALRDQSRDRDSCHAHVAQLVEHSLGKGEVTGSSPVMGTRQCCDNDFSKNLLFSSE